MSLYQASIIVLEESTDSIKMTGF